MANFKEFTRYTGGKVATNRSGRKFLVLRQSLNLQPADGDIFITITQDIVKRPDLISFKAYSNPSLWWVIYEFNNIRDPLFQLQVGQVLRIPQLQRVISAISNLIVL